MDGASRYKSIHVHKLYERTLPSCNERGHKGWVFNTIFCRVTFKEVEGLKCSLYQQWMCRPRVHYLHIERFRYSLEGFEPIVLKTIENNGSCEGEGLCLPSGQPSLADVKESMGRDCRQKAERGTRGLGMDDGLRDPASESNSIGVSIELDTLMSVRNVLVGKNL